MKQLFSLIIAVAFFSFTVSAEEAKDLVHVPGPLTFHQEVFHLAWTGKANAYSYTQEYLPKGETVERFNQMLSIFLFDRDVDLQNAIQQKVGEIEKMKKTDELCNYRVIESPDGGEFIIDFLVSSAKGDKLEVVELNLWRYKKVSLGNSKKGLLVYAYHKRAYGDDIMPFLKGLSDTKADLVDALIASELPAVELN